MSDYEKVKYKEKYIKKSTGEEYIVFAAGDATCVLVPMSPEGYVHDFDRTEFWLNGTDIHSEFERKL
ncbi:hypothetical protein [Pectinatus frisingensis]|uniref:hypothetical protein n=1 Tax=Pectinatus frisingensis TaxID=865 RepID=UPI0018C5CFD9|nr:hypothetical protein [Pectinatus frisingensis]